MAFLIGLALAISDGPRLAQLAGPQQMSMKGERLGRHKRYPDSEKNISALYASVSDAYNHPGIDEKGRDGQKTQALLAEEFGISRLKVRKILITTRAETY